MIDLHTHILPGIDDGARSMSESLEMAAIAADCGVRYIVATPHSNQRGRFENYYSEELIRRYRNLKNAIDEERIPVDLLLGMEIFASDDLDNRIRQKKVIGINGSRYFLVEWNFDESPDDIFFYLKKILGENKVPIIAHPERYYCVQEYPSLVRRWREMGCETQVNKGSIFGRFGENARMAALYLLENNLVTCIGTDAHSARFRSTYISDGADYITDRFGFDYANLLFERNPLKIIKNEDL